MTYLMQLAVDPKATPTPNGSVTHYAELSPAPPGGYGMIIRMAREGKCGACARAIA